MNRSTDLAQAPAAHTAIRLLSIRERFRTFTHALFFVLGFTTIFVLVFGLPLYAVGRVLGEYRSLLALIGAVVVILFGLSTMGVIRIPWLNYDTRRAWAGRRGWGYLSSYFIGVFFAAGWSPCIGTTLGAILTLGYAQATVTQGLALLIAYSLGLGIPFLVVGLSIDRAVRGLRQLQPHIRTIELVSGMLMIGVGLLVLVDALPASLYVLGQLIGVPLGFSWPFWLPSLRSFSAIAIQEGWYLDPGSAGALAPTALVAFAAGLLSFLSPCVLPLVPAYVSYLGGHAVQISAA
jgi:cytochrome c-type biogenesis protein